MKELFQPEREPEVGAVYRISSRNLSVGVYVGDGQFIGIREKFWSRFLDQEGFNGPGFVRLGYWAEDVYHVGLGGREPRWVDTTEAIGKIEGIPLTQQGDPPSICGTCGGRAWWVDDPEHHYTACVNDCEDRCSYWNGNTPLFEALDEFEKELFPDAYDDWFSRRRQTNPEED